MENQKIFRTPAKTLARMQVVRFGKIMFNMQFIGLAIMLASVLSFILPAIYYLMLVCIGFLSLGALLLNPEYLAMWEGGDTLTEVAAVMTQSWKYTVPIVLVLAAASIVCLCFDKKEKHIARIVISSIIAFAALVVLIFKLINSGVFQ